ncbi:DUF3883 domain-containing protein [bacterium]|nr:DUF3883 domain-containing protein [bacterium]
MARLEDIAKDIRVRGLDGNKVVKIVSAERCGGSAVEVFFRDDRGNLGSRLLYRGEAERLEIVKNALFSFDADGEDLRLASEAFRISLAHLFDPYLAVHTSSVEALPHQISAVYQEMIDRLPLRYVLADDPGAGKTVMTGLLMKELIMRGDLKRCLIVSPGSLSEQWQDELKDKFGIVFDILTNERIESAASGNIFSEINFCIARLDKLARDESLKQKLEESDWDLIVIDEAHKMSATVWGGEVKETMRYKLGKLLSHITRDFLLLTATPHNGKEEDFQLFMALIDPDRFAGAVRHKASDKPLDVSDVMRRLVKEDLLKFDGSPLFPERRAETVNYGLSEGEKELYQAVTEYVRGEFNRAENLSGEHRNTVGFALTVLQRRLASSPEAIYQSLKRRYERLERRLKDEEQGRSEAPYSSKVSISFDGRDRDYNDYDDYSAEELEREEEDVAEKASAARTVTELKAELASLKGLVSMADEVRRSGEDRKWDELSRLLLDRQCMLNSAGLPEKLIIFTEHRDTLNYLSRKISGLLGSDKAVITIHGGMHRSDRRRVEAAFKQDRDVRILIATDAAGEGINLQCAHLMINYDLPWNPNRLEQRFGRIHRIGQTEVCLLWNIVAGETREGMVFQRLFSKLEEERKALGGKVFDILGGVTFDNKPLRELLIEAVRCGDDAGVRSRLSAAVDRSVNTEKLRELIEENALTADSMDLSKVMAVRAEMERAEARRLQPHYIKAFFLTAFRRLGGRFRPREANRYELTFVPSDLCRYGSVSGKHVLDRYERICFEKAECNIPGKRQAELICPGHPLLEAVVKLIRERFGEVLRKGAVLVDENDGGFEPRFLCYIEESLKDGVPLADGRINIISRRLRFAELKEDGTAVNAGYAPYLDYKPLNSSDSPLSEDEIKAVYDYIMTQSRFADGAADRARDYAIENLIPEHLAEVKERRYKLLDKIEKAVEKRLSAEIRYWDNRAIDLRNKDKAGEGDQKLNSDKARRRAEELTERKKRRLAEIEAEREISSLPPNIAGGALIIPGGLLRRLLHRPEPDTFAVSDRKAVETAAMEAVMKIERALGYIPKDVSAEKCGCDVESAVPPELRDGSGCLRFIEVKGRAAGATTVTVSKNEILTALNCPDSFILALVEVDGRNTRTVYLRQPFKKEPDQGVCSINYNIKDLLQKSEILYQE